MRKFKSICLSILLIASLSLFAQKEKTDATVQKIRQEEMNNSKVMDIAFHLTDVSGPRLTVSPGFTRATNLCGSAIKVLGVN
jgi:hypothetical protein